MSHSPMTSAITSRLAVNNPISMGTVIGQWQYMIEVDMEYKKGIRTNHMVIFGTTHDTHASYGLEKLP